MNAAPTVDVIIPAYNSAMTIGIAIGSIQKQTLHDFILHVVDDGSTDNTSAIVKAIALSDKRLRLYTTPNYGVVYARNLALSQCTARYVAMLDSDDIAHPQRLAVQVSFLEQHPDIVAVGASARHINIDGTDLGTISRMKSPEDSDPYNIPAHEPYIITSTMTATVEAINKAGRFRHSPLSEDSDLCWRLQENGHLHNMTEVLADYRLHSQSVSAHSIINGRVMAIGSQLAAFSARRRRQQSRDLTFTSDFGSLLKGDTTLAAMSVRSCALLDETELPQFNASVAGKLMELASYRPFELEESDCRFIRDALAVLRLKSEGVSQKEVRGQSVSAAARLAHAGKWRSARLLLQANQAGAFLIRVIARLPLLRVYHRVLIRRSGRSHILKPQPSTRAS